ncbi:hypothetical protein HMPREF1146_2069 [Prevotella sp. MSX73]|nr:hypothetical protein HMPREF1146_2069 [Prevotella sp. MSX73]
MYSSALSAQTANTDRSPPRAPEAARRHETADKANAASNKNTLYITLTKIVIFSYFLSLCIRKNASAGNIRL